jgi:hypothetical protein
MTKLGPNIDTDETGEDIEFAEVTPTEIRPKNGKERFTPVTSTLKYDNPDLPEIKLYANTTPMPEDVLATIVQYNDETIPQELINECKMLGYGKPPNIGWIRWHALTTDHKIIHEHMIMLKAMGKSDQYIADELGYTHSQVYRVLKTPAVAEAIKARVEQMYDVNVKQAMSDRALKALGVVDQILDDENGKSNVRLDAAKFMLEHTVGKAQQTVKHEGNLLAEVIATADKLHNTTQVHEILTKPSDPMDNMINEMLPTDMVVGVRNTGDKQEA